MQTVVLRKYNDAATFNVPLTAYGLTDLASDIGTVDTKDGFVVGDVKISLDETTFRNPTGASTARPRNEGSGFYSLTLDAADLCCKRLAIVIKDQDSPKRWEDEVIIIETFGHLDAQHPTAPLSFSAAEFGPGLGSPTVRQVNGRRSVWELDYTNATQPTVHLATTRLAAGSNLKVGLWWDDRGPDTSGQVDWQVTIEGLAHGSDVSIDQPSAVRVELFKTPSAPTTIGIGELVRTEMTTGASGITIPDHELLSIRVRRRSLETTDTLDSAIAFYMLDFIPVG